VPVSILEDFISTVLSILAIVIPILIGTLLLIFAVWVARKIWHRQEKNSPA